MATNFKDTLNLPKTNFPMRANLAQREPKRFAAWKAAGLYKKILEAHENDPSYILHVGPPYANGNIHVGHVLTHTLKDLVVRSQTMMGHHSPFVPGWDCHGLPIEQRVLREIGDKIHDMEPLDLRRLCKETAAKWTATQSEEFQRLGIIADWEDPYITMDPSYEAGILKVLHSLVDRRLIYRGFRTVSWDWVFRTALAEAEIEYHEHESPSIYVAMPLVDASKFACLRDAGVSDASLVIWTTTPWTMPANLGVTLHPEFTYIALRTADGKHYIIAEGLREAFEKACKLEDATVAAKFKATDFNRGLAKHPIFDDRESLIMLGDHVTLEQGTGCVHTAPGHGADDFIIGQRYGLPVFCPVDAKGNYTQEYPEMAGTNVFEANPKVVELLKGKGLLVGYRKVRHEYPYSWRSKQPIIFRATEQWFVDLSGSVREQALKAIDDDVTWVPGWGQERIRGMVERRPEWCISRQRHWGVPIPAIRKISTNEVTLDAEVIAKLIAVVQTEGTDAWYARPVGDFLPEGYDASDYEKTFDILDVWFDSGASHVAVLEQDDRLHSPADMYLEGSDQHRGWFQASLLLGIGARDHAPFKTVLTHGFVLDDKGEAMSKSKGNVIAPKDLIKDFGSDILRLWVASTDYRNDVAISKGIVKTVADTYRTIRNTLRFQISNLDDFDYAMDAVALDELLPLDRWALHKLAEVIERVTGFYQSYEFHRVYRELNHFFTVTLSARYHDFLKDRLYTMRADGHERRSAQTVIHHQFHALLTLAAPILVFTTDEAWAFAKTGTEDCDDSIHTQPFAKALPEWFAGETADGIDRVLEVREQVNEALERLRSNKVIGQSLDAAVTLKVGRDHPAYTALTTFEEYLPEIFIASQVTVDAMEGAGCEVVATKAEGNKCPRCWRTLKELSGADETEVCSRCAEALSATTANA